MKKPDKWQIYYLFCDLLACIFTVVFFVYLFIIANRSGPMLEQEQYNSFGADCINFGFITCYIVFCGIPTFGRTFALIFKKVKNGNPKAEKGEKGIENGTDDFNRI